MAQKKSAVIENLEASIAAKLDGGNGDGQADVQDDVQADADTIQAEIIDEEPANLPAVKGPASDVEPASEISPASAAAMAALNNWLELHQTHDLDPAAAQADIIAQIMAADTIDEVLGDTSAPSLRELVNVPIRIHDGKFNRSDFEAGAPWYALLDITRLDNGRRGFYSTGAQSILAQLVRLIQLDSFPCNVMPINARKRPAANGYMPMRLKRIM